MWCWFSFCEHLFIFIFFFKSAINWKTQLSMFGEYFNTDFYLQLKLLIIIWRWFSNIQKKKKKKKTMLSILKLKLNFFLNSILLISKNL